MRYGKIGHGPGCGVLALAWCLSWGGTAGAVEAAATCESAIAAHESRAAAPGPPPALPPGLLRAIARVESGGNPWAFNVAGASAFGRNREDAVARVRELMARGIRRIDVGCMQISLQHHPHAFRSLDDAFEPALNVAYAARFLGELHQRHGNWPAAIAHYHSATPERGQDYLRRVNLAWNAREAPSVAPRPAVVVDRVTVMISPAALQVQVVRPASAVAPARRGIGVEGRRN